MRDSLCSLELAGVLLRTIEDYDVAEEGGGPAGAPSLVARTYHVVLGEVFIRFAFAHEAGTADVARWAGEDPQAGSLLILLRDDADIALAEALQRQAARLGRHADVRRWQNFFGGMLSVSKIKTRYNVLRREYYATEGEGFTYVNQQAVIDERYTAKLLSWSFDEEEPAVRVVFVVAEYGEGKSSFCLNYVFEAIERVAGGGPIPLLFNLNEFESGNLKAFIAHRLREDYGLEISYAGLRELCRRGVVVPVLDAFDQMHQGDRARIARDYRALMELCSEVSPLFVTCRAHFFEQHVQTIGTADDPDGTFRVVALRGFNDDDLRTALGAGPGELLPLLSDPENQMVLGTIHLKPLMLHVILSHRTFFTELVADRRAAFEDGGELRTVTEYDVFSLLYEGWLRGTTFKALRSLREANSLMRLVASRVQMEGMNQPVRMMELASIDGLRHNVATPEAAQDFLHDLQEIPLLNPALLRRDEPAIAFRFNAYLEFVTARSVVEELNLASNVPYDLVKQEPLTWEARQMVVPNLTIKTHGDKMRKLIEGSRHRPAEVKFGASNVVTLMLDCIQHARMPASARAAWKTFVQDTHLEGTQLQRLDARGADLTRANLSDAHLQDADFSFAVLRDANFTWTKLKGAVFKEAGAVLTTVFMTQSADQPDHWRLAGGTENGMVVCWDSELPHPTRMWLHRRAVRGLASAGRDAPILSVALDGVLGESDPENPEARIRRPLGLGGLRALALTHDDNVIVGGDQRKLVVLDRNRRERHRLSLPEARRAVVTSIAIDEQRQQVFVGDQHGDIYVIEGWEAAATGVLWRGGLGGGIHDLRVMRDGALLAFIDRMGALVLRDARAAPERLGGGTPVVSVGYAAATDTIAWHDGKLVRRQGRAPGAPPERIGNLPKDLGAGMLSCSADGSFVAVGGDRIVVWHEGYDGIHQVRDEPMQMDCAGMLLTGSVGLTERQLAFIVTRGGMRDEEEEASSWP